MQLISHKVESVPAVVMQFVRLWFGVILCGRPFVKRFALCYGIVVCLCVCLSCNVGVLWPNGWIDQDATWYEGRPRPGHIELVGDPAPPKRGTAAPTFRLMSVVAKRLNGSRCHLVRR